MQKNIIFWACLFVLVWSCTQKQTNTPTPEPEVPVVKADNFVAFENVFHNGSKQGNTRTVSLPTDLTKYSKIWMYVRLQCPTGGCGAWDVYANIYVKDAETNTFLEIARYITPYGVDNAKRERGFKFDVTDFKSLLTGTVDMKTYIECWTAEGWNLSIDFDYEEGTPDYKYYAVSPVIQVNSLSIGGIEYGVPSTYNPTRLITIPANAEKTHLRTIISGWGEAYPTENGRPCAEWCFKTHNVQIDGANTFVHELAPLGCSTNPVQPQGGNWSPDRAGWCPGMEVPTRIDTWQNAGAGTSKRFTYVFAPWTNNNTGNKKAYYAISTMVVVKSNTPITKPIIAN